MTPVLAALASSSAVPVPPFPFSPICFCSSRSSW
jgi:hypothetical protein